MRVAWIWTAALAHIIHIGLTQASLNVVRSLGQTISLSDKTYYVPGSPEVVALFDNAFGIDTQQVQLVPVTVIARDNAVPLDALFQTYAARDDVWNKDFGSYVILDEAYPSRSTQDASHGAKFLNLHGSHALAGLSNLPSGPYFAQVSAHSVSVFRAYRVYADPAGAFYYGTIEMSDGSFQVLTTTSPETSGSASIAVPSRLYYTLPNEEKPLSGIRIGVKDIYDLKGLRTSAGSRAWFNLYPPANRTAESIQYLIDLGAVVVGKTRTSQFANGESPTADWVDFHDPFNARGDGYQDPSSSSAGAGSAESNYDWIDMNIGSDTGGSVRAPAAVSGVFGNRPSQGIMTLNGVVSMSKYMDTPAFVARSATEFASWGRSWYSKGNESLKDYEEFPTKLIYPIDTPGINTTEFPSPGFFPASNERAQVLYEEFTLGLERILRTERTELDFFSDYRKSSGSGLYPTEHLGAVWGLMTAYEQHNGAFSKLSQDWAAVNEGDQPYFDPPVAFNFEYGGNLTATDFQNALTNKTMFKNWLENRLLISQHGTPACSSALLIHPIWHGTPSYRDEYPDADPHSRGPWFGWNQYGISQLGGVPEVVLPIGQVNYTSRITKTTKWLPVAVSINAAAGCDLMLFRLVERLAEEGIIPERVGTGRTLDIQ